MIDMEQLLELKFNISSVFSDAKLKLGQAARDTVTITVDVGDSIYVGYYKKINTVYMDIPTPSTTDTVLSVSYWNGTEWSAATVFDETLGLTRSGFIQIDKGAYDSWEQNEIDSTTMYWLKMDVADTTSEMVFNFVGLMFSDDASLEWENPYINDTEMLLGNRNHLGFHMAARDEIIRNLCSKSYYKVKDGQKARIVAWDLLDIQQVRQASIFSTLSKIYFNLSDSSDDHWMQKSEKYKQMYEEAIKLAYLTLDTNDDGETSQSENMATSTSVRLFR